ncbi:MAG TPA: hypothetical protein VGH43_00340 [Jatrophihabitans sp.]|jgi:hypothetical protein
MRHPVNLYVRHDELQPGLHEWLASLLGPNTANEPSSCWPRPKLPILDEVHHSQLETRRQDLTPCIARLQDATEAGADPAALVDRLNAAHSDLQAIDAGIASQPEDVRGPVVDDVGLRELLNSLGNVAQEVFTEADPTELAEFYRSIGLTVSYDHESRTAEASVTLRPGGHMAAVGGVTGVRGGT